MFTEDDVPEPTRTARARWNQDFGGIRRMGTANHFMLTHMASAANWLDSRANTHWATDAHYGVLMADYAKTLKVIQGRLADVIKAETMSMDEAIKIALDGVNYIGERLDYDNSIRLQGNFSIAQLRACIAIINATPPREDNDEL